MRLKVHGTFAFERAEEALHHRIVIAIAVRLMLS